MRTGFPRVPPALAALLLATGIGLFYLGTTRRGLPWMDDYVQYISHAANIADGRPYAATGYIFNPHYPYAGPVAYPPVFPLALAPLYKVFGLDLRVMKAFLITAFCGFLYAAFLLFRRELGWKGALAAEALVGLNPVFWEFKDNVYPDLLFLLFAYAALAAFERARGAENAGGRWKGAAFAAGLLLYLAYGTRTVGALLAAAFLVSDLARGRGRPSGTMLLAGGTALAGALLQGALLGGGGAYVSEALSWFGGLSPLGVILDNAATYPALLASLFDNGFFPRAAWALLAAVLALAAAGFLYRARREFGALEAYAALNPLFLLVCPLMDGIRYCFPLIPLLAYYAFLGWRALAGRLRAPAYAAAALPALVALSYSGAYARAPYGDMKSGAGGAAARELFAFVSSATAPGDAVVFRKPRSLAFFTGRRSSMYYFPPDDAELLAYFERLGAACVVSGPFEEDRLYLEPFLARNTRRFRRVFYNGEFSAYRPLPAPGRK
jgi:hypothetical protein